jgi:hypothetical protein
MVVFVSADLGLLTHFWGFRGSVFIGVARSIAAVRGFVPQPASAAAAKIAVAKSAVVKALIAFCCVFISISFWLVSPRTSGFFLFTIEDFYDWRNSTWIEKIQPKN